jgi:hypothetical protein
VLEHVARHGALDDFVGHHGATHGLAKGHYLAHGVLDHGRRTAKPLDAALELFALADRFLDVFLDAGLEHRVVLDARGLPGEHLLGLLFHGVGIAQPVEQVFAGFSHLVLH